MTTKEVFEHDWKEGEKVWLVYYKYNRDITEKNGMFMTKQPAGVIEATVKKIEWSGREYLPFKNITIELDADWKNEPVYSDTFISVSIYYDRPQKYSDSKWCVDKFFNKKDAEKRYKVAVKNWNKKVIKFQDNQRAKIEKAKQEYEKLKAAGTIDISKHITQ